MAAATTGKTDRGIQIQADPQFSTKNMNISPERLHVKIQTEKRYQEYEDKLDKLLNDKYKLDVECKMILNGTSSYDFDS